MGQSYWDLMEWPPPREPGHKHFDEAVRVLFYALLKNPSSFTFSNWLRSPREKWPQVEILGFQRGCAPLMFDTLPEAVTNALSMVQLLSPQVQVTRTDEYENVFTRPGSQPALISPNRNWSLPFSADERAEPKMGMEQNSSENNLTIYVRTSWKRRKSTKTPPETESRACAYDITEEDDIDNIETAASSTLSE